MRRARLARALLALAVAAMSAACGQWAGAPARVAAEVPLPLGPQPVVRVAVGQPVVGAPVLASHGRTLVLAWIARAEPGAELRTALSRDAGATFTPPLTVAALTREEANGGRLETGLVAPGRGAQETSPGVWARVTTGVGFRAWSSTSGDRSFADVRPDHFPESVAQEGWRAEPASDHHVSLLPPGPLRAAGARTARVPSAAVPGALPAVAVDEHGAFALAWREASAEGTAVVLRRAWLDWNASGAEAEPFDSPTLVAERVSPTVPLVVTDVPGGVVVAWAAEEAPGLLSLYARGVGLDMTCAREPASAAGSHGQGSR